MTQTLIQAANDAASLLLIACWRALPLLAIAAAADLLLRRRLAPRVHVLLWSIVVARLLLPISLPSPWSLHNAVDRFATYAWAAGATAESDTGAVATISAAFTAASQTLLVADEPTRTGLFGSFTAPPLLVPALLLVWGLVAAMLMIRAAIAHLRFARYVRRCPDIDHPLVLKAVAAEADSIGVRRGVAVKEVAAVATPAVFGLMHSTLCFPPAAASSLSHDQLRLVLRHELAHLRRYDAWLLTIAAVMRSLYWFNPLSWLVASRLRFYIESAADDVALARSSPSEAIEYANLLLRFAQPSASWKSSPTLGLLYFATRARLLKRIQILTPGRSTRRVSVYSAIAVAVLALVGLTDGWLPAEDPADDGHKQTRLYFNVPAADHRDGDLLTVRMYDVAEVLDRIQSSPAGGSPAELLKFAVGAFKLHRPPAMSGDRMIVEATAGQHRAIAKLLDAWRIGGDQQISLEVRAIEVSAPLADSLDWSRSQDAATESSSASSIATVSDERFRQLMQDIQSDARSEITFAPKVTLFNGQAASIVQQVESDPADASRHLDEDVASSESFASRGVALTMEPSTAVDGRIALAFAIRTFEGKLPASSEPRPLGQGAPPEDQPVFDLSGATAIVDATVQLSESQTVLVMPPAEGGSASSVRTIYAITPRQLDLGLDTASAGPQ